MGNSAPHASHVTCAWHHHCEECSEKTGNPTHTVPGQQSMSTSPTIGHVDSSVPSIGTLGKQCFISVVFLPQIHKSCLIMRKTSGKSHVRDGLQNAWAALFKTIKFFKNKGSLWSCPSLICFKERGAEHMAVSWIGTWSWKSLQVKTK